MHDLIKAAKSLSDETRLRILSLLLVRECCVCEVMQVLGISQTRASRNLNVLYNAGFLKVRREGLWAYYSINQNEPDEYLSLLLSAVEKGLAEDKVARGDREKLKTAARLGPVCCNTSDTASSSPAPARLDELTAK